MVKKFILEEFLKNKWKTYILGIATLIITGILQITIPKFLGFITDLIKDSASDWRRISWFTAALLGISAIVFLTKTLWRRCLLGNSKDLDCFLRGKLFAHLQTLSVSFYNNRKTGDLMAYAINDLNAVKRAFSFGLVVLIDGVVINLGSVVIMAKTINPLLTAVTLIPVIASVFAMIRMRSGVRSRFTKVQEAFADISDKVEENISGIRYVNADNFINQLPGQYDGEVKERGCTFSSGQKQLLSFARALAFKPSIIVLDEATSNIDTYTEQIIQNSLSKLSGGRTILVIAHRLSTIKAADSIFVIDNGRIKETGTHDKLMAAGGIYKTLVASQ